MEETEKAQEPVADKIAQPVSPTSSQDNNQLINASGHVQELDRNFSLLSLAAVGITVGSTWPALGSSIVSRSRKH